jgi:hypothetical protein
MFERWRPSGDGRIEVIKVEDAASPDWVLAQAPSEPHFVIALSNGGAE